MRRVMIESSHRLLNFVRIQTYGYCREEGPCGDVRLADRNHAFRAAARRDMQRHHVRASAMLSHFVLNACMSSFLHDHSHYAVAQKKYVFIYDRDGVELHRLKSHIEPTRLEFLPYHWLIASVVRCVPHTPHLTAHYALLG